jgi:hypothetical protein
MAVNLTLCWSLTVNRNVPSNGISIFKRSIKPDYLAYGSGCDTKYFARNVKNNFSAERPSSTSRDDVSTSHPIRP